MKKKNWIILAVVVGLLGGGVAVAYFLFWEDILLLMGEQPGAKAGGSRGKPGGVNLVQDFSSAASPAKPQPATAPEEPGVQSGGTEISQMPEEEVGDAIEVKAPEESGGDGEGGDEGEDEEPAGDASPTPEPPAAAPKKESVPTISRKTEAEPEADELDDVPAQHGTPAVKPPAQHATPPQPRRPSEPAKTSPSIEIQKKAQILIQRRELREAEIMLTQYLAANPADGDVHFMAGFLHIQQNRKAMAISHFQKAAIAAADPQIRQMAEQYLKKLR